MQNQMILVASGNRTFPCIHRKQPCHTFPRRCPSTHSTTHYSLAHDQRGSRRSQFPHQLHDIPCRRDFQQKLDSRNCLCRKVSPRSRSRRENHDRHYAINAHEEQDYGNGNDCTNECTHVIYAKNLLENQRETRQTKTNVIFVLLQIVVEFTVISIVRQKSRL